MFGLLGVGGDDILLPFQLAWGARGWFLSIVKLRGVAGGGVGD